MASSTATAQVRMVAGGGGEVAKTVVYKPNAVIAGRL